MLSLPNLKIEYEPYPIGVCAPAFAPDVYAALVESFPPLELFGAKEELGHKYSLSEVNQPDAYHEFVRAHPPWAELYAYVKSETFVRRTLGALAEAGVDLGLGDGRVRSRNRLRGAGRLLSALPRKLASSADEAAWSLRRALTRKPVLGARFEFSVLPGDGGHILPHTDAPQKVVTLVVSMLREGEWRDEWGGGTEVLRPKDPRFAFNKLNRYLRFDEVERIRVLPFRPNQCVVFVKTFNSLHAVSPVGGGGDVLRRTLTVNIERLDAQP